MPNKDGVEACREIMDAVPDIRVVMLTASTEEDAVIEAVAVGAQHMQSEGPFAHRRRPKGDGDSEVQRVLAPCREAQPPGGRCSTR